MLSIEKKFNISRETIKSIKSLVINYGEASNLTLTSAGYDFMDENHIFHLIMRETKITIFFQRKLEHTSIRNG